MPPHSKKTNKKRKKKQQRRNEQLAGAIGVAASAIFISSVTEPFTAIVSDNSWIHPIIFLLALVALSTWAIIKFDSKRARTIILASVSILLCTSIIIWASNETARKVHDYALLTCEDGMWEGRKATCYPEAEKYIVNNYTAFDPETWHSWGELPTPQAVSLRDINFKVGTLIGKPITSVGHVLVSQPLDGLVIQIQMLRENEVNKFLKSPMSAALYKDTGTRELLAKNPLENDELRQNIVYCHLPPRPFFYPDQGELIAFTGTVLATGMTFIPRENRYVEAAYITCSSAERIE